jgi:hypothetical protein
MFVPQFLMLLCIGQCGFISADEEVMTCGGESYFKERGLQLDVSDSLTS